MSSVLLSVENNSVALTFHDTSFPFLHKTDDLRNIVQFSELKVFKETHIYTEVWMQLGEGDRKE